MRDKIQYKTEFFQNTYCKFQNILHLPFKKNTLFLDPPPQIVFVLLTPSLMLRYTYYICLFFKIQIHTNIVLPPLRIYCLKYIIFRLTYPWRRGIYFSEKPYSFPTLPPFSKLYPPLPTPSRHRTDLGVNVFFPRRMGGKMEKIYPCLDILCIT